MPATPPDSPRALGEVELLADLDRPGGWVVLVDRVRQSYVDLDDPTYLDFEYTQHFADVLETVPDGPLAVTHVGGGGLTMARYLAAVRPGSPQIVLEPDPEVTARVRAELPLPRGARVRIRAEDGRAGMPRLRDGSADVVILDAFHGARVPAELTTAEFFAEVGRVLAGTGVLLINIGDGPPLQFTRRLLATVRQPLPHALLIAHSSVLRGRRYGNLVIASGRHPLAASEIARTVAGAAAQPHRVLFGAALDRFAASALPLTDAAPMRSPSPPDGSWRVEE